jgi:peptidoglycan/LPS O-acetylase OafA/YrhL
MVDRMTSETEVRQGFRPEIQGMRAVAVLLVIAYHLYPGVVSGGYVGVDVFFVVSGYLITALLYREAATTSGLSLTAFWSRRIRRLLPTALLVLVACVLLTWAWVPRPMWDETLHQIGASALYVENWALAADAVDYSAVGTDPTLVQHYWSLAVEEQFYLVWPLLVLAALLLVRRTRVPLRPVLAVLFAGVAAASFAYSVTATADDAARAYFVTPTRAWEFAVGALIGLAGTAPDRWWRRCEPVRVVLGWAGLAAVLGAGLVLDDSTSFPGWIAAVPVLGTVAVIAAGTEGSAYAVARPLSLRPATRVGDVSYSMYLWHWPLLVVMPFITGVGLRDRDKVAVFLATLLLALVCTRWLEDPVRSSRLLADVPSRAYALAAAGLVVVVAVAGALQVDLDQGARVDAQATEQVLQQSQVQDLPCIGPAALEPDARAGCSPVAGTDPPVPGPVAAARETNESAFPGCHSEPSDPKLHVCSLGTRGQPVRTVAIVGDSHAAQWFGTLDAIGKERGWRVRTFTRSGCPLTDARALRAHWTDQRYVRCRTANKQAEAKVLADPAIDTVFVTADSSSYTWSPAPGTDGFRAVWGRLTAAGRQVVVIRDVPEVKDHTSSPTCVAQHAGDPGQCANPRGTALAPDAEAAAVTGAPAGVRLVDLTGQFCDATLCYAVVGGVMAYRDAGHLTDEYAALLAPYLARAFDAVDAPV